MFTIAIDSTTTGKNVSGWERSTKNLFDMLNRLEQSEFELILFSRVRLKLKVLIPFYEIYDLLFIKKIRKKYEITHYNTIPPKKSGGYISWCVHDNIIVGGNNEYRNRFGFFWEFMAKVMKNKIDVIFTFTDNVKNDLQLLGYKNVVVVTPIVKRIEAREIKPELMVGVDKPFIVIVGSIERRKNPDIAARLAMKAGYLAVVVGRYKDISYEELPAGTIVIDNASDENLSWLYKNCEGLISASSYEGVNMPIIEASLEGKPAVYSDIPTHLELYGEENSFNLNSEDSYHKIKSLIERKSIINCNKFTDEKTIAESYMKVWSSLIKKN